MRILINLSPLTLCCLFREFGYDKERNMSDSGVCIK